ncbi:alanine dehydrogenase [Bacteroidota bacterium]
MDEKSRTGFHELAQETQLYPQESLLKVKSDKNSLFIGLPKEISLQESRIVLTPDGVGLLTANGHEIWIETGAGKESKYTDQEYSDAGAKIVYSAEEVYKAEIILKVEPPTLEELEYIKPRKSIISAIQLGNQTPEFLKALIDKKITALGYELIEDKAGGTPLVRAMSEIAGCSVMLIAAEYLSSANEGKGIILGGISGVPPTKVIILGAGTVAEHAARAALGLGVDIQVFDDHIYKLRRIKHALGHQIFTSTLNAVQVMESLKQADVVIGAIRSEKGRNRCIVTDEMVSQMKPGSVIIDVNIDQGGCIETSRMTTHSNPVYTKHDVIHYCVPNIASRVPRTATQAINNIFTPILLQAADEGGIEESIFKHNRLMKGVYAYKGHLTNADIATKFSMEHKDINLFIAARF